MEAIYKFCAISRGGQILNWIKVNILWEGEPHIAYGTAVLWRCTAGYTNYEQFLPYGGDFGHPPQPFGTDLNTDPGIRTTDSGSGSCTFRQWCSRCQQKPFFSSCLSLFEDALKFFFIDKKSLRSHKTVEIKVYLTIFAGWCEDPDPSKWWRIRIPNTALTFSGSCVYISLTLALWYKTQCTISAPCGDGEVLKVPSPTVQVLDTSLPPKFSAGIPVTSTSWVFWWKK